MPPNQVSFSAPEDLCAAILREADSQGRSVSNLCAHVMAAYIAKKAEETK